MPDHSSSSKHISLQREILTMEVDMRYFRMDHADGAAPACTADFSISSRDLELSFGRFDAGSFADVLAGGDGMGMGVELCCTWNADSSRLGISTCSSNIRMNSKVSLLTVFPCSLANNGQNPKGFRPLCIWC
jgi:hypothetical protein